MALSIAFVTQISSLSYLLFLVLSLGIYYFFGRSYKVLLILSIVFYATFSINYTILFLFLCVFNYLFGLILHRYKRKVILTLMIVFNVGVLIFFRYVNISIAYLFRQLQDVDFSSSFTKVVLPLGISFFTFEMVHYTVEVYKGKQPVKSLSKFILFPFFFPSQIAGPIKRYETFMPQLQKQNIDWNLLNDGVLLIVKGLFKKIVIADKLIPFVSLGFNKPADAATSLIAMYAFAFQIFFDFSGYTDIGRGSAQLFGIRIPINFNQPYLATNIRDFWKRWHMTLLTWFRDYLYIPLGGKRVGKIRFAMNTLIVFGISGMWHGTAVQYLYWGLYHGLLVILSNWIKLSNTYKNNTLVKVCSIIFTFHLVMFGWVFFRSENMMSALSMIQRLPLANFQKYTISFELLYISIVLILYFIHGYISAYLQSIPKLRTFYIHMIYGIALVLIFLGIDTNNKQFIYFQF